MHKQQIVDRLVATGWLPDEPDYWPSRDELREAVAEYQEWWRLRQDGFAGPITQHSLAEPRICPLPDRLEQVSANCFWRKARRGEPVTWTISGSLAGISQAAMHASFTRAFAAWTAVAAIDFRYVEGRADITITTGRMQGNTLAWANLPCAGDDRQLETRYNTGVPWVIAVNPPTNQIDLDRVAIHEIGHLNGIGHLPAGNILQPTYSRAIRLPQTGDIAEAVRRYGEPDVTEPPPPPPEGDVDVWWPATVNGKSGRFQWVPDE